jgi:AAA+ ATPase superfamily predicted ATPase
VFQSSVPVTSDGFHDRAAEMGTLAAAIARLQAGAPAWMAVIGPRKVGKTSLVLEAVRRAASETLAVAALNVQEDAPPSPGVFRLSALRAVDALLGRDLGESLERLARVPADYRRRLQDVPGFAALPPSLRADILDLADVVPDAARAAGWLQLPETLAAALERRLIVVLDEFQELAALGSHGRAFDPFPLMRSVWQTHTRVAYIISGSARSMLLTLLTEEHSPFFQHFGILELGPFGRDEAISLLQRQSPPECPIGPEVAGRAVDIMGGHPFYLQMLGEVLTAHRRAPDMDDLKAAVQELVFSRMGRLGLYFENDYDRLVGRAASLAATLNALAEGASRLTDIATRIGAPSGAAVRYIERLRDSIRRRDDGLYELADPVFALWLRWRKPGGAVVPMALVGDEAEQAVASALAAMGFDLVYQSRASRGSFDLLGLRGGTQLGIQVKRSALPLRFGRTAWARMEADAARLRWVWVIASVDRQGSVTILDPARARRGREVRLDESALIENLLTWVDKPVAVSRTRSNSVRRAGGPSRGVRT